MTAPAVPRPSPSAAREIPLVLLRIHETAIALEAARVVDVDVSGAAFGSRGAQGAHDLAELLRLDPPAGARCVVKDVDGQRWIVGATARRATFPLARFQRVPGLLEGLRERIGLIALLVGDAGVPYLVLRPRAG